MFSVAVRLALLLSLAGCAGSQTPAVSVCRQDLTASLPLRVEGDALITDVTINDRPTAMMVDTGSTGMMVTQEAQARLQLPTDPNRTTHLHGTGGTVIHANALIRRIGIGGLDTDDVSAAVGELGGHKFSTFVAGIIGADYLSLYDLDFDVPDGRLNLYQMSGCGAGFRPAGAVGGGTPLLQSTTRSMLIELHVERQRAVALLDTGAAHTAMTLAAAHRLGVTDAALAADPAGTSRGVDGTPTPMHLHQFSDVDLAGQHLPQAWFAVGGLRIDYDLLLGVDWLRTRRVWVSYAAGRLFLLSPAGEAAERPPTSRL